MDRYASWDFEKPLAVVSFIHEVDVGLDDKILGLEIMRRVLKGARDVPLAVTQARTQMLRFEVQTNRANPAMAVKKLQRCGH